MDSDEAAAELERLGYRGTYLDDPNHDWSIQDTDWPLSKSLRHIWRNDTKEEDIALILRGYAELKQRHPNATDRECFNTSMVWFYG